MSSSLNTLPRIFCKPPFGNSEILFSQFAPDLADYISFRSLDIEKDIDFIYSWVNAPYAIEFWNMDGSKDQLIETYSSIISCPHAHSFIGMLGSNPVCQIDVYRVLADELSNHVTVHPEDCGMHLLMAPNHKSVKGFTGKVVTTFLKFYFSFPIAYTMYGEPDTNNHKAKMVLCSLGFEYLKEATLTYKTASLYRMTRQKFNPILL